MKNNLTFLFIFIVGVLVAFVFVWPAWQEVDILSREEISRQKSLKNAETSLAQISEFSEQFDKLQDEFEKLSLSIPKDPQLPELVVQFEDIVRRNGLIMNSIKFNIADKPGVIQMGGIGTVKIDISLEGGYQSFKKLIEDIENNVRLMDVVLASFSPSPENPALMKYSISVNAYYSLSK